MQLTTPPAASSSGIAQNKNMNIKRPKLSTWCRPLKFALALVLFSYAQAAAQSDFGPLDPDTIQPVASEAPIPTKNMLQIFHEGGPLLVPIGVCSFLLMVFVFERAVSLRHGRVIPRPFVRRFLEQLREGKLSAEEAVARCEENRSPVAEVFGAAARKWGRSSVEVEQAIIDTGERVSNELRRHLRLLNGISISAFNEIATSDAMGRPELLAAGIGQALLTTAAGLTVAIPALIAYLFFVSRVDRLIMEIDSLGQEIVNLIAADGWKPTSKPASKTRKGKAA